MAFTNMSATLAPVAIDTGCSNSDLISNDPTVTLGGTMSAQMFARIDVVGGDRFTTVGGWSADWRGRAVPATEVAFIDPAVTDLDVLLGGLRPEVEPILLNATEPGPRQMARALAGRGGLEAIHIIAHGAPG